MFLYIFIFILLFIYLYYKSLRKKKVVWIFVNKLVSFYNWLYNKNYKSQVQPPDKSAFYIDAISTSPEYREVGQEIYNLIQNRVGDDLKYRDIVKYLILEDIKRHPENDMRLPKVVMNNLSLLEECLFLPTNKKQQVGSLVKELIQQPEEQMKFIYALNDFEQALNSVPDYC